MAERYSIQYSTPPPREATNVFKSGEERGKSRLLESVTNNQPVSIYRLGAGGGFRTTTGVGGGLNEGRTGIWRNLFLDEEGRCRDSIGIPTPADCLSIRTSGG